MSIFVDIFSDSLTAIGQLGTGQSPSTTQAEQGLRVANRMFGKWSTQRLMLYYVATRTYTLSAGTQDYTIGPSGSIGGVATRPTFVESGQATLPGSAQSNGLSVYDKPKWDAIGDKGAACSALGLPQGFWPEYTYPNITLHFWPVLSNSAGLTLGVWDQLTAIATIFDDITFPPGYEEAFMWGLAMELCPYYDMPVSEDLAAKASDAINSVKQINAQGLGGALGDSQTLVSPNVGNPQS